jgi:hypothetical protein
MAIAVAPGFPHCITQRGNDQQAVFNGHDGHSVERVGGLLNRELKTRGKGRVEKETEIVAVSIDRP